MDHKVQLYLKKVRNGGGVVSASIAVAAAHGLLMAYDKCKLADYGCHVKLGRHRAYGLLECMQFVRRKATTAKSKHAAADFIQLKEAFLNEVVATVTLEDVSMEFF